jgi:hypothetical protein
MNDGENAMSETLTGLIFCYVAYVLYEIVKTFQAFDGAQASQSALAMKQAAPAPPPKASEAPVAEAVVAGTAAATTEEEKVLLLRDPATGETCPPPSNYRFAKKWVKEALVKEGLLNKVYKNSELNAAANPVVKQALERFRRLEKYRA